MASQVVLVIKKLPAKTGNAGLIPGLARFPEGGNGTPFQYSCRENPMDKRAWQTTVLGVRKSQTQLSNRTH